MMAGYVLVVDDNEEAREIISLTLETIQVNVRIAADGRQALQAVQKERPGLILLDIKMPFMDGFQFMDALHEDDALHDLPIIVVSAYGVAEDVAALQKRPGVIAVLRKGAYHIDDMRRLVSEALQLPPLMA